MPLPNPYIEETTQKSLEETFSEVQQNFEAIDVRLGAVTRDYAVTREAPINVEHYGASTSKTAAQNSAAFALALADLPAVGGTVFFPGSYEYDTTINLDSKRGVVFEGQSGHRAAAGAPLSRLNYTGTGAGDAITAKLSTGITFKDLAIAHTDSGFTGTVVNFAGTDANNYATFPKFVRCWITGNPPFQNGTATGVDLKLIVDASFENCLFESLTYGVKGSVADPATSFSNTVIFDNVYWSRMVTGSVLNPGQQWTFTHCTFQQLVSGASVAVISNFRTQGLAFIGCGFWDCSTSGSWLVIKGEGTVITGCLFGAALNTRCVDAQSATNNGLVVAGNRFQGSLGAEAFAAVDLDTGKPNVHVFGNSYEYVTNKVYATDQPYAATSGMYHKGESGELSGIGLYPTSTYNRALEGGVSFPTAITTGQAVNNSIFRDSADNIFKHKDNAAVVHVIPSYATAITGDGVTAAFTVTHNLGTNDVHVTVFADAAPKTDVIPTVTRPSVNSVTVTFGAPPAVGLVYRVVVSS